MSDVMGTIQWLTRMSKRLRFGKDNYVDCLTIIRDLIAERKQLTEQVERLESELARLQTKPKKSLFGIEGQGTWGQ